MTAVKDQTVHTGHTINIRIGSTTIGRAQGLDGDRSFGTEGIYEIGSIMPKELINMKYEGTISMERFFIRNKDLATAGYASIGEEVLKKGEITIEVVDKYTGKVVRAYHGCVIQSYRENFRVNGIAGENATWLYKYAS